MKRVRVALVALAIAAAPLGAQEILSGSWDGRLDRSTYLNLKTRNDTQGFSNYGRSYERGELLDLRSSGGQVTFRIARPAGVLAFRGTADHDESGGTFTFTVSPAYRQQLQALGFREVDAARLFVLALGNLSIDDVKYLDRVAKDDLTTSQLVRMVHHGVSREFVKGLAATGFSGITASDIVATRTHGVTPEYINALRQLGHDATLTGFIRARDHGVSSDYANQMRAAGFKLSLEQLITARDHGVSADYVKEMAQHGYAGLAIGDYVRLRDHGVSGNFVRRVNRERSGRLDVSELIKLKSRGH